MNKILGFVIIFAMAAANLFAAELTDVKPIISGSEVTIEITADIPMTYTYYSVPNEARAVVDIADADPEKIEPLIVVNKGAVSSISVDKAQIANLPISRIIFNLVTESSISVSASADRKKITVSFIAKDGAAQPKGAALSAKDEPLEKPLESQNIDKVSSSAPPAPTATAAPTNAAQKEDDPLGLDDPPVKKEVAPQAAVEAPKPAAASTPAVAEKTIIPVIPPLGAKNVSDSSSTSTAIVENITIENDGIVIQTKPAPLNFNSLTLDKPLRIVIDIDAKRGVAYSSKSVKRFAVEQIRVAENQGKTRVVFDIKGGKMPKHKIIKVEKGIKVVFK